MFEKVNKCHDIKYFTRFVNKYHEIKNSYAKNIKLQKIGEVLSK